MTVQEIAVGILYTAIAVMTFSVDCKETNKSSTLEMSDMLEHSLKENIPSQDKSLFDVIVLAKNMENSKVKLDTVCKAVGGSIKQKALMRQIFIEQYLFNASRNISKEAAGFENTYNPTEVLVHQHLIDEMMILLDALFATEKSIVVFTDQSEYGQVAFARILQRCLETKRRIAAFKIVSLKTTNEEISKHMKSDMFVLDCDGKIAEKLLQFAKEMGYTGYRDNINWVLSHRTMSSLPMSCSLPLARLLGIQVVLGKTDDKYASTPSANCNGVESFKNQVYCRRTHYNVKDVIVKRLRKSASGNNGNIWDTIKVEAEMNDSDPSSHSFYQMMSHLNPFWPRFNVAVADTFHPWVTIVDFVKTVPGFPLCGTSGKYGHRYENTTNVTVPICAYGIAIDIIKYLEETLEINCDVYVSRDGLYGSYDESTGKATGIIKEISSGAADFAVDMIEDTARRKAVEFTTPYEVTHYGIAYVHSSQLLTSGVFYPFSGTLWLVTFIVLSGLTLFLWTLEKTSSIKKSGATSEESQKTLSLFDSMEYIWGTMCCGEIILNKPIGFGGRLLSVFASCFLISIVAHYSAELVTSFVVNDETHLITGLKDIMNYGNQIGTQKATGSSNYLQNHHDAKVRELFTKMQIFNTYQQSIDALKSGKIKFFVADFLSLRRTAQIDRDCTFRVVKADSNFAYLGICLPKGSPLIRKLNLAAAGMTDSGKKDKIFNSWLGSGKCKPSNAFYPLELAHFRNLVIFVSYGLLACLCILCISLSWKRVCKYRGESHDVSQDI